MVPEPCLLHSVKHISVATVTEIPRRVAIDVEAVAPEGDCCDAIRAHVGRQAQTRPSNGK